MKKISETSPLLLDTHIWLWLMEGTDKIKKAGPDFLRLLETHTGYQNISVSVISIWEVGMLASKKRIQLPMDPLSWTTQALKAPGFLLEPITPQIAIQSSFLEGFFHGDPADRILVATAKETKATLVTSDERILNYCQEHHLPAVAV